jgi:hypothetical protein
MSKGRPSKYTEDFPILAEGYAREGLNDKEIAAKLGISIAQYYVYQNDNPDFSESIKRGKAPVDTMVENALLKRALGYDYTEQTTEIKMDAKGIPQPAMVKNTVKHVAGDIGAMAFWLKNRKPAEWKDKHEMAIDVNKIPVIRIGYESDDEKE